MRHYRNIAHTIRCGHNPFEPKRCIISSVNKSLLIENTTIFTSNPSALWLESSTRMRWYLRPTLYTLHSGRDASSKSMKLASTKATSRLTLPIRSLEAIVLGGIASLSAGAKNFRRFSSASVKYDNQIFIRHVSKDSSQLESFRSH